MKNKRDIIDVSKTNVNYLLNILDQDDFNKIVSLKEELKDTWIKKQVFRTETEMRMSVLSDGKFPTKASKYWQCVREQSAYFENMMSLSFDYRKTEVEIKKLKKKIEEEQDDLEKELYQIRIEEMLYSLANMELIAKDRMREIELWSKIKKELDDGTFDNKNVNTHQAKSYKLALENKIKTLTPSSSQPEVINLVGQLSTLNRLAEQGTLNLNLTNNKNLNFTKNEDLQITVDDDLISKGIEKINTKKENF